MSGLLFTPENALKVLHGTKTQTRRLRKPGETFYSHERFEDGGLIRILMPNKAFWRDESDQEYRTKWECGHTYATVPGRGKRAMWYRPDDMSIMPAEEWLPVNAHHQLGNSPAAYRQLAIAHAEYLGYRQLRVRIQTLWAEQVQDISGPDCIAEGINPLDEQGHVRSEDELRRLYFVLWDSINKKPGTRSADNPSVWCVKFEVVKEPS